MLYGGCGMKFRVERKRNHSSWWVILGVSTMVILISACLLVYYGKIKQFIVVEASHIQTYKRHYVMITEQTDSEYWEQGYQGALEEAIKQGEDRKSVA